MEIKAILQIIQNICLIIIILYQFSGTKNLDKGISEYYNLIYEYQNDCLSAAVEYNKTFYSDGDLKPQNKYILHDKNTSFCRSE